MKPFCIIPAKGTSTRIPGKNIRMFHGKPMLAYSIIKAKNAEVFGKIIVSTDSDEVAKVAKKYGAEVFTRDKGYCTDEHGPNDVVGNALYEINKYEKLPLHTCCVYATVPLLDPEDIVRGYRLLRRYRAPYAISVNSSRDRPIQDAAQFIWGRTSRFISGASLFTASVLVGIEPQRVCDINTEEDWLEAERRYEELRKQ